MAIPSPHLDETQRAALRAFFEVIDQGRGRLEAELDRAVAAVPALTEVMRRMTPEQLTAQRTESRVRQRRALVDGDWTTYLEDVTRQAAGFAQGGVPFSAWFELLSAYRKVVRELLMDHTADRDRLSELLEAMNLFVDVTLAAMGEAYLSTKERIIGQQQDAIRELSTPVLQVRDRLLIIPVVGVVDTRRARHLTESMLRAIRDRRARAVVMDITGVPVVDSKVANHLAQACEAGRLMGARVILTGVAAEIAQALVTIGAELHGVETLGDLQSGIEEAERQLGFRMIRTDVPRPPPPPPLAAERTPER